jgi:anti-sigma factor ChrR (cupin superfamily)
MSKASMDRMSDHPDLLAAVLAAIPDGRMQPDRRARLRERVLARAAAKEPEPLMQILRADQGAWRTFLPRIQLKLLRLDRERGTQTSLWRLEPGAVIPAHDHDGEEECLILEGGVTWDDVVYGPGDYLLARPGLRHTAFHSEQGALLMIRSELTPELEALFAA